MAQAQNESEIKVTRQMREAGAAVIAELSGVVSAEYMAEQVYIAMDDATIQESPGQMPSSVSVRKHV